MPFGPGGDDADGASLIAFGDAVFDGVFDDRLEDEHGDLRGKKLTGNIHGALQAVDEADLLDVKILSSELQLLCQGHLLPIRVFEHAAHEVAQFGDHGDGCVVSLLAHQAGDGIQRVEKKVWLDLPAKRAELRCHQLLIEPCGLGLLKGESLPRVKQVADEKHGCVEHEGRKKAVVKDVAEDIVERSWT